MRNITVSMPDDVYREARIRVAERGSSAQQRQVLEGIDRFGR